MEVPDTLPECREGQSAFDRFKSAVSTLLTTPREVYEQREAEYQRRQRAKPNRPGPKPKKVKTSSSARASRAKG
jgi:hypothetical protein